MAYENPVNELIEAQEDVALPSIWVSRPNYQLTDRIFALVASANRDLPVERHVLVSDAYKVAERSLDRTQLNFVNSGVRVFTALREVEDFIRVSVTGDKPKVSENNLDLLPVGHPLTASAHISQVSGEELVALRAEWFAADPRVVEEMRPIVASAYVAKPNSAQFKFSIARLEGASVSEVPRDVILTLLSK